MRVTVKSPSPFHSSHQRRYKSINVTVIKDTFRLFCIKNTTVARLPSESFQHRLENWGKRHQSKLDDFGCFTVFCKLKEVKKK